MTLSRRSFLKVAGLTAVSVAGASMFTGCTVLPDVEVTLVDKSSTVGWTDNKYVSTTKLPWFIVKDSTEEKDAIDVVTKAVKDKNSKALDGKEVKITNLGSDKKIKIDKKDEKKYTLTIEFDLVAKTTE